MNQAVRLGILPIIVVTALSFTVKWKLGIAVILLTVFPLLFANLPRLGIWLVLFCIPFDRLLLIAPGMGLTLTKLFIAFTATVYVGKYLLTKDGRPLMSLVARDASIIILAYFVASVMSLMNVRDMSTASVIMIKRTSVIVMYFLALNIIDSKKALNQAFDALLLGSAFICVFGIYEFITGDAVLPETVRGEELAIRGDGSQRIQGGAGESNLHAAILVLLLPLLTLRLFDTPSRLMRYALSGLLVLYAINIFGTNTRNGLVGMILALVVVFIFGRISRKFFKAVVVGGVMFCLLVGLSIVDSARVSTARYTGESGGKTVEYRIGWMKMGWEMGRKHPIIGGGPGSFVSEYHRYRRVASENVPLKVHFQHNGILQAWGEMGIIGVVLLGWLIFAIAWAMFRFVRDPETPDDLHSMGVGLFSAFVVFVFTLGVVPALEHEVGWLIMAFCMCLLNVADQRKVAMANETNRLTAGNAA